MARHLEEYIGNRQGRQAWDRPSDHVMPLGERLLWRVAIYGPVLAIPVYLFASSPFTFRDAALHYLTAAGCPVAEHFGVAPAKQGEPGYHARLDGNRNGIACEPEPKRNLRGGSAAKFLHPGS